MIRRFIALVGALALCPLTTLAKPPAEVKAREILNRFAGEPSVRDIQQAALGYAALHPEMFEGMRSRSRIAPILPQIKVRIAKDLDEESKSLTRFAENSHPEDISATETKDDQLGLQGEASWSLDELIFNTGETTVVKENRYASKERQQLLRLVTELYFERRKAQVKLALSPAKTPMAAAMAELKISQLTGEIDALTGGALSRGLGAKP